MENQEKTQSKNSNKKTYNVSNIEQIKKGKKIKMKIILASKSPRRRELLDLLKLKYEVIVSNTEEKIEEELSIEEMAKKLSHIKAKTVFDETVGDRIVIGSDTMVVKDGKIYGKPKDKEDAYKILQELNGQKHQVITGLAILVERDNKFEEYLDYDITDVYFKNMDEKEIKDWIATGEAMDKAGAYAIQGSFSVFIEKINGNYASVMGLPVHKVYEILKKIGRA